MSLHLVRPFIALAEQHGFPDALAYVRRYFGLTKAEVDDPETRVPVQRVADLFNGMVEALGNRDLGLIAARFVESEHMGIAEFLARSRPTMREAFASGDKYTRLLGDGAQHDVAIDGKLARWRIQLDPALKVHEAAYEFFVAIGVLGARRMTGVHDLAPIEVHFMHPQPASIKRHTKLFACPIRFGMPVTQVLMTAKFLERRPKGAEPELGRLLERQANQMLTQLPAPGDLIAQLRSLLSAESRLRDASAERISRQLGMNVRTLARKLRERNTSYRELLDHARKQVACRELRESACPISELAYRLGFSSTQGFHRAFRRWTGTSAARWREDNRLTID